MHDVLEVMGVDSDTVECVAPGRYCFDNQLPALAVVLFNEVVMVRDGRHWDSLAQYLLAAGLCAPLYNGIPSRRQQDMVSPQSLVVTPRSQAQQAHRRVLTTSYLSSSVGIAPGAGTTPIPAEPLPRWRKGDQSNLSATLVSQRSSSVAANSSLITTFDSEHTRCLLQQSELQRRIDQLEARIAHGQAQQNQLDVERIDVLHKQVAILKRELEETEAKLREESRLHRQRDADRTAEHQLLASKLTLELKSKEEFWQLKLKELEQFHTNKDMDLRHEMDRVLAAEREAIHKRMELDLTQRVSEAEEHLRRSLEFEHTKRALDT